MVIAFAFNVSLTFTLLGDLSLMRLVAMVCVYVDAVAVWWLWVLADERVDASANELN